MRAAVYYRRSTNIQEHSIDMQRQVALNRSTSMLIPIDLEFIDDAISARKTDICDRPALASLFHEIEQGTITTLFVYKRDRLARIALQYLELYQTLKKYKVKVIFTSENEFPMLFTPVGELIELLMAGIIQREGEQIVERITETIKANFLSGKFPGTLPYGYSYDCNTKEITRIESELAIVISIYEAFQAGKSVPQIRTELTDQGTLRRDKPWKTNEIKSILENSTYMGERVLQFAGDPIKRPFPILSVVDEITWMAVQDKLQESVAERHPKTEKPVIHYALQDLVICKLCEKALVGRAFSNNSQPYLAYYCTSHRQVKLDKTFLEQLVFDHCTQFFKSLIKSDFPKLHTRFQQKNLLSLEKHIAMISARINQLNQQLMSKTEKWLFEPIPFEKVKLEEHLINIFEKLEQSEQQKAGFVKDLELIKLPVSNTQNYITDNEPLDEDMNKYSTLFKDLISSISIDENNMEITYKHPFLTTKEVLFNATG
jgi:site-specific DNA recombinase